MRVFLGSESHSPRSTAIHALGFGSASELQQDAVLARLYLYAQEGKEGKYLTIEMGKLSGPQRRAAERMLEEFGWMRTSEHGGIGVYDYLGHTRIVADHLFTGAGRPSVMALQSPESTSPRSPKAPKLPASPEAPTAPKSTRRQSI